MKRPFIFILLKIIFLQTFFYYCAKYGPQGYELHFLIGAILITVINYLLVKTIIDLRSYALMAVVFFFSGFINDLVFIRLGIFDLGQDWPPLWLASLWLIFLAYYGDVFNRFLFAPLWFMASLGSLGGFFAYYRGLQISGIPGNTSLYIGSAVVWSVFMPVSLIYFRKKMLERKKREI